MYYERGTGDRGKTQGYEDGFLVEIEGKMDHSMLEDIMLEGVHPLLCGDEDDESSNLWQAYK